MAALDVGTNPRTLVLCFDGTTGQYDSANTNVVRFFSLLEKDNVDQQLVYYQPGVGTYFKPGVVAPILEWAAKVMDEAIAWYLPAHIMDGYRYVMQNYRAGDKICLFGFSRGAYTARALAGFLYKVGLLPRDNDEQITFAYTLYRRTDAAGLKLCQGYKRTYCRNVKIEFIGVWDTVSSVGIIAGKTLPFVMSNTAIKRFRHALSLDERRCRFQPNAYHRPAPNQAGAKDDPEQATPVLLGTETSPPPPSKPKRGIFKRRRPNLLDQDEEDQEEAKFDPCDVLEVWFAGCHSDIGGGAVPNNTPHSLADITLRWMVNEVMASECGILFNRKALARNKIPIPATPISSAYQLTPVEASNPDKIDALQPLDDELVKTKAWWILEILPLIYTWQDGDGVWHKTWRINGGRGRTIYDHNPKLHITVKQRIGDVTLNYSPNATWEKGKEVYVG